ncbi:MAG TPA: hypothetical protein VIH93_03935, partial [Thermoanaerobaculia bacterium]
LLRHLPSRNDIAAAAPIRIELDVAACVERVLAGFKADLSARDLLALVCGYPLRETQALTEIAKNLGFKDREQYEGAVRKLLLDDDDARSFVRSLFGGLETLIGAESEG